MSDISFLRYFFNLYSSQINVTFYDKDGIKFYYCFRSYHNQDIILVYEKEVIKSNVVIDFYSRTNTLIVMGGIIDFNPNDLELDDFELLLKYGKIISNSFIENKIRELYDIKIDINSIGLK